MQFRQPDFYFDFYQKNVFQMKPWQNHNTEQHAAVFYFWMV